MKKFFLITMLVTALAAFGATVAMAGKQTICHFPPGNPDNWHTIVVSDRAVASHVEKHGDLIGSCAESCEALCDDGDFCTQDVQSTTNGDCVCNSGIGPAVDCDDSNECTADSCSSQLGACVNDTGLNDGNVCDDGDPATTGEQCNAGVCAVQVTCPCEVSMVERSETNWSPAENTELFAIGPSCGSQPPLAREVTLIHRTTPSVPRAALRVIDTGSVRGVICETSNSTGLLEQGEFLSEEQYAECRRDILDYAQILKVEGLLGMDVGQCAGAP